MNFADEILNNLDFGYLVVNPSSELLFINKIAEDFLAEFGLISYVGAVLDLGQSEYLSNLKQSVETAFSGTKTNFVLNKSFSGKHHNYRLTCIPAPDESSPQRVIIHIQLIEELQDTIQKYRSVYAQLKTVLETYDYAIIILDEKYKIINFNNAAVRQSKKTCGKILNVGNNILDIIPPSDQDDFKINFNNALSAVESSTEKQTLDQGGNLQHYCFRYVPIFDEDGNINEVLFSIYDNSIHKQNFLRLKMAEYELNQSNKELLDFKYAVDISSIVSTTDVLGVITYVNSNFCKVSGYSREELIGKSHSIMKSGYHSDSFFLNLWNTIKSGKTWQGEILNKTKDGNFCWLYTYIIPFINDNGEPYKFYSVRYDITKAKRSKQLLQDSLKQKEALLAEVYHRVKNNLNVVVSLLSLQANRFVNNLDTYDALMESKNRIYTMALVHEKLYQTEDLEKIDFKGYVTELFTNLSKAYNNEKHKVRYNINSGDFSFSLETCISLGLILNELFSNSMKHGFVGSIEGTIHLFLEEGQDEYFVLRYSDSGDGFKDSGIDNTSKLGLKLVKALVSQIKGQIIFPQPGNSEYTIRFKV